MSKIVNEITPRAFELIRNRIVEILIDELSAQSYYDDDLDVNVYMEKSTPFQVTQYPAVNVMVARGGFDNYTISNKDGNYEYNIDILTSAKSTSVDGGDSLSSVHMQRIMGVCDAILSDSKYNTLGYAKPFISRTQVEEMAIAEPQRNNDAESVMHGRLKFTVRVPENVEKLTPVLAEGFDTSIKIGNTDQGFKYTDEFGY